MVLIQDNFLSTEHFDWLKQVAIKKAASTFNIASKVNPSSISKFYTQDRTGWDYNFLDLKGDITTPAHSLGKQIIPIIENVEDTLVQFDNSIRREELVNAFFMFAIKGYEIPKHMDVIYSNSTKEDLSKIYKAFIFCHDEWSEDWGGELCFHKGKFAPKPNRLLIYSGDEEHWVNLMNDNAKDSIRKIFGLRYREEKKC
jgi:hypothetical protein